MADDFTTISGVDIVLGETAGYAVDRDVAAARRRATALERKLDFAISASESGRSLTIDADAIQAQLDRVYEFLLANEPLTSAQRLANPSVLHADFSTFGQYRR